MERLTNIGSNGEIWITDNDETRRFGRKETAYKKLAEYENLYEQGLLLMLPCKVGDSVYKPNPITLSEVIEIKIESIFITEREINISGRTTKMKYSFCCSPSDFGKTVFLTKAEADQQLNESESNCDGKVN